jgi:peroxiredoxin
VNHWRQLAGILLILAVMAVACSGPGQGAPQGINTGQQARDFTFETLDGRQVSLSDHKGKVVLVNLWATWCAPCRDEIPDLEAAYQAHQDEGFIVLGVNQGETRDAVQPFVDEFRMTYPVLLDEQGELMKIYRGQGLPMSLIVDGDGVLRVRHVGYLTAAQLDDHLAPLLP